MKTLPPPKKNPYSDSDSMFSSEISYWWKYLMYNITGDYEMAHDGTGASKIVKMWEKTITTILGLHVIKGVAIHQFW